MKKYYINFQLLKDVIKNNGNCLCRLNCECPCLDLTERNKCHCKVFEEVKNARN